MIEVKEYSLGISVSPIFSKFSLIIIIDGIVHGSPS
jgi:hypothetical protein